MHPEFPTPGHFVPEDHLDLLSPPLRSTPMEREQLRDLTQRLKRLMREHKVAVLIPSARLPDQTTTPVIDPEPPPMDLTLTYADSGGEKPQVSMTLQSLKSRDSGIKFQIAPDDRFPTAE